MENGHYAEAVIEFDNAIKIDSNYADARYQLAKAYLKLQQWPRAYEELKRVVELQPENYAAHFDLAKILIANGSFQQAQEQIDFLRQKQPNDSKTHFIFATLLAAQANYSEAIPEMQRAIALDPSNWDSYLNLALMQMKNNQADSAEANFKKAVELVPSASDTRLMLGNYDQSRRRFREAEQQFREGIRIDPQNLDLRSALARLFLAQGRRADAEEFFKQVKHDFPNNSVGYRMLGDYYFTTGDLERAATEYGSLYSEHPKDYEVKKNDIQLLILTNRFDQAEKLNDELLSSSPNDSQALLYSGEIQLHKGQARSAAATFQKLIENDPKNGAGHFQLALALQELGDQDSAERELRDAVRFRPDLADAQRALALLAMRKGDSALLEQAATQLISLRPAGPDGYALRAISAINRKQFASAEADVRKAIEVGPQSQLGYVQMGNLRFAQKQYPDAASAYQQALERDVNSVDALRGLINTYIVQNHLDKALAAAQAQIAKSPGNGDFYDLLGTLLFKNVKDLNGAETALRKSVELNGKNLDAVIKLGQLLLAQGKTDQAIATYQQALKDHPGNATLCELLGEIYQSNQDWRNAEDFYQKALTILPEAPQASGNLAYVMVQSGQNLDVALSLAQTARRGLPKSPSVAATLGWIYYQKGAYRSAIDSLREAVALQKETLAPDDPAVHYHLGMAYSKVGQAEQARQQLRMGLKIDPNSAEAAEAKREIAQLK